MAEALNTVQETALELAVEQAVLRRNIADSFVNLGRRNQNLWAASSTSSPNSSPTRPTPTPSPRCSASTTSPPACAATPSRCSCSPASTRRGAAHRCGSPTSSARPWARSRTTSGSRSLGVEPATVVGSAAADLAHLIAEFVENALTFSPPDQNVEVRGRHIGPPATARHHRQRLRHGTPRTSSGPTAASPDRELHRGAVEVPGPLRRRQPGRPPRGHAAPRAVARIGVTALIHLAPTWWPGPDPRRHARRAGTRSPPCPALRGRASVEGPGRGGRDRPRAAGVPGSATGTADGNGNANGWEPTGASPAAVAGVPGPGAAEAQPDGPP